MGDSVEKATVAVGCQGLCLGVHVLVQALISFPHLLQLLIVYDVQLTLSPCKWLLHRVSRSLTVLLVHLASNIHLQVPLHGRFLSMFILQTPHLYRRLLPRESSERLIQ